MTTFTNRAALLASGAREVTMEELDWVSGGSTASVDELDPEEIVVNGDRPHGPSIGCSGVGVGVGSGNGGGGTNLAFAGFFATHGSYGSSPKFGVDPDVDGDGIPNESDPTDDTIVVTATHTTQEIKAANDLAKLYTSQIQLIVGAITGKFGGGAAGGAAAAASGTYGDEIENVYFKYFLKYPSHRELEFQIQPPF